ncbi:MAG: hypothetical protein R3Y36_07095 [Spirochaetales bacterium]
MGQRQIKHLRANYKQFHIDFKIDELNTLKLLCKHNDTTLTTVIKSAVADYVKKSRYDLLHQILQNENQNDKQNMINLTNRLL